MADYIDGEKIEEFPEKESLSDSDIFIAEDEEDTKQIKAGKIKAYINAINHIEVWFAVSESPTFYPSHNGETIAIVGEAVIGKAICGDTGTWYEEIPEVGEDEYLWAALQIELTSGEKEWMEPFIISDAVARNQNAQLDERMKVAEEELTAAGKALIEIQEEINKLEEKLNALEGSAADPEET